jgi:hypothetical protein
MSLGLLLLAAAAFAAPGAELHVALTGSDAAAGTAAQPVFWVESRAILPLSLALVVVYGAAYLLSRAYRQAALGAAAGLWQRVGYNMAAAVGIAYMGLLIEYGFRAGLAVEHNAERTHHAHLIGLFALASFAPLVLVTTECLRSRSKRISLWPAFPLVLALCMAPLYTVVHKATGRWGAANNSVREMEERFRPMVEAVLTSSGGRYPEEAGREKHPVSSVSGLLPPLHFVLILMPPEDGEPYYGPARLVLPPRPDIPVTWSVGQVERVVAVTRRTRVVRSYGSFSEGIASSDERWDYQCLVLDPGQGRLIAASPVIRGQEPPPKTEVHRVTTGSSGGLTGVYYTDGLGKRVDLTGPEPWDKVWEWVAKAAAPPVSTAAPRE